MQEYRKENKMGVMPENKLLLTMSVPMMISMLIQALYNVVDSIFVSQISQDALNAVSLAFPAQNLMIAVAVGAGVGVNATLSKRLGEQDHEAVNRVAANGLALTLVHFFIFFLLGLSLSDFYYEIQTTNQAINEAGAVYMRICMMASPGLLGAIMMERLLQSTGRTIFTMITQGMGAITNIILDPILIFGYFGAPQMGVAGAAVATVAGQFVSLGLCVFFNLRFNSEIKLNFKGFRFHRETVRQIYGIGIPTMMMNALGSVVVFGFNQILLRFTEAATAVFGVYFKLQSFVFMPVFGLNNGMVPIIAYNYGARKKDRIIKIIKLSIFYAVLIMAVGLCIFQLIPRHLLLLFHASEEMLEIGVPALRIISLGFLFAGYNIVCGSVFQAFGRGVLSLSVSVVRQVVVLLPVAFVLALTKQLELVWLSTLIAEVVALILSTICLVYLHRREIRPM